MNLDSLTDTVTNLAGALVLLVILVLGLTRSGALRPPAAGGAERSERSIERLVEQVNRMRLEIKLVDQQVRSVEEELPKLRERVKELRGGKGKASPDLGGVPTGSTVRNQAKMPAACPRGGYVPCYYPLNLDTTRMPPACPVEAHVSCSGPVAENVTIHRAGRWHFLHGRGFEETATGRATPSPLGLGLNEGGAMLLLQAAMGGVPGEPAPVSRDDLQGQIVREAIEEGESQLNGIDGRVTKALDELMRLLREVQSAEIVEKSEVRPPEPPKPEDVVFRPPLEEFTQKEPLMLYCRAGRISFVDRDEINKRIVGYLQQRKSTSARRQFEFDLPGSELRCLVTLEGRVGPNLKQQVGIVQRQGAKGELAEAIGQSGSKFKRVLALNQPQRCYAYFGVWPDSFEVYRRAREIAWDAGYEVGWVPMAAGTEMSLGGGHGMTE